jgi:anti-sigma regulatory factor (Ser/Thr protein kinase)
LDSSQTTTETCAFAATAEAVVAMDGWIESVGKRWGIDERTLFRARVCVSELAANVVEHGGVAPGAGKIIIALRPTKPTLEIEMSDPGKPFDPFDPARVESEPREIGGRGLRLVRAYAQRLAYRRDDDRNIITLQIAPVGEGAHSG